MSTPMLRDGLPPHARAEQTEDDLSVHPVALPRHLVILLTAVSVVALAINVLTLTTFPDIHTDEAWYANLAQNWIATGKRWTTLDAGPFPDGRGQGTTLLGAFPTRIAIQLWGLNLRAIRLPSLLAGLALLGVVAAVGHLLWPGRSGPLAALLLALQQLFLLGSHVARPEIWLTLVVLLAFGCSLLGWKHKQPLWDVAAALLAVLSLEIHQNGVVFVIGLAATYLARHGRRVLRHRGSLAFVGTGLVGALVYFYRHPGWVLPGQGSGGLLGGTGSHSIPLLSMNPLCWVLNELARYVSYFGRDQIAALLLGFGIGIALHRRSEADNVLLAWLLGSAIALMLLVNRLFELYLFPLISVGMLFAGRGLADLLQHPDARRRQAVAFILFTVLTLPLLLMFSVSLADHTARMQRQLRETIPCQRILGPNQYWLAFTDCHYRSFDVINHYHHVQGLSFTESMAAIRPDYLIVDETLERKLHEGFGSGGDMMGYYALPRAEFEQFLEKHTSIVRLLIVPGYGTIQIRQVHWETGS